MLVLTTYKKGSVLVMPYWRVPLGAVPFQTPVVPRFSLSPYSAAHPSIHRIRLVTTVRLHSSYDCPKLDYRRCSARSQNEYEPAAHTETSGCGVCGNGFSWPVGASLRFAAIGPRSDVGICALVSRATPFEGLPKRKRAGET